VKSFLKFAVIFLGIFALAFGFLWLDRFKRADLVVPRTVLGGVSLSGMTREEARIAIRNSIANFDSQPIQIAARGIAASVTFKELGIQLNESSIFSSIPFSGDYTNPELILWSIAGQRITPNTLISRPEVLHALFEKFPDIPRAKNASFVIEKGKRVVSPESEGLAPDLDPLLHQLRQQISFLDHQPVFVDFKEEKPNFTIQDLEQNKEAIKALFPTTLSLTFEKKKWDVNFDQHPDWITFSRKPYEVVEGVAPFSILWEPISFSQFLDEKIASALEQPASDVRIWKDSEDKIQFDGHPSEGRAIDRDRLLNLANTAIADGFKSIEISLLTVKPKVEISEELKSIGINEIVSIGHTRFVGSPPNRVFNIGVGITKFNGLIIPRGITFSFGDNLGVVDGSTGYKKELVIKPEGTIPEFGGGICQVSSTMYRAAIFAGFPIVERKPHKYVVTYYSQIGGHGLDATVYPPSPDLKFKNDSPGEVLVQSYVDGMDAYFVFYGTSDGRLVEMEGPHIYNQRSAPSEPMLVPDKKLQPGERKQVEKAHAGFDTLWYRRITKDGQTVEEKITSHYEAVPDKFLVGGEIVPAVSAPATNPFE
jgi:vancomycin resistance protein YoaR